MPSLSASPGALPSSSSFQLLPRIADTDTAALAEIDAHVSFLKKYYASGNFPEDSFDARGLADFRSTSQRADDVQQRIDG